VLSWLSMAWQIKKRAANSPSWI